MEITQEEFKNAISALATKDDLKNLVTKDDLDNKLDKQTRELKTFAEDQAEKLAVMVSKQVIREMEDKINMAVRMATLENQMSEIRNALHLSPSH